MRAGTDKRGRALTNEGRQHKQGRALPSQPPALLLPSSSLLPACRPIPTATSRRWQWWQPLPPPPSPPPPLLPHLQRAAITTATSRWQRPPPSPSPPPPACRHDHGHVTTTTTTTSDEGRQEGGRANGNRGRGTGRASTREPGSQQEGGGERTGRGRGRVGSKEVRQEVPAGRHTWIRGLHKQGYGGGGLGCSCLRATTSHLFFFSFHSFSLLFYTFHLITPLNKQ